MPKYEQRLFGASVTPRPIVESLPPKDKSGYSRPRTPRHKRVGKFIVEIRREGPEYALLINGERFDWSHNEGRWKDNLYWDYQMMRSASDIERYIRQGGF